MSSWKDILKYIFSHRLNTTVKKNCFSIPIMLASIHTKKQVSYVSMKKQRQTTLDSRDTSNKQMNKLTKNRPKIDRFK